MDCAKIFNKQHSAGHLPSYIDSIGMEQNIATHVLWTFYCTMHFLFSPREAATTIHELHLIGEMPTGMFWWFRLILHILCESCQFILSNSESPHSTISDSSMVCPRLPQNCNNHLHKLESCQRKMH